MWYKLDAWLRHLIAMLPNLVIAAVLLLATFLIARLVRNTTEKVLRRFSHSIALNNLVANVTSGLVLLVGVFFALGVLGLDKTVTSLLAGVGIIGLALGFAFQDLAANFISGVIIAIRRPFNVGDEVESNGHAGTIEKLNLRTVDIRKYTGEMVIIPNRKVFEDPLINFTYFGVRRVELELGVGYDTDLKFAQQLVKETLEKCISGLAAGKEVKVLYQSFGDSAINMKVWMYIDISVTGAYTGAKSDAIMAIKAAFDKHDINIPYPIQIEMPGKPSGRPIDLPDPA